MRWRSDHYAHAGIDVPADWAEAARRLASGPVRRVLLLGAPDAGKSTLARFLCHEAGAAGQDVALLDADPAQKLVGPPACVTLGRAGEGGDLALAALGFVAAIDPVGAGVRLPSAAGRLAEEVASGPLLANTDGMLTGPGGRLKAALIRAVRPDLLVTIGGDEVLSALLARHAGLPRLRLAPSPLARRKTRGERREARRHAFRRHLAGASDWTVPTGELATAGEPPPEVRSRLLVGLADAAGRDLALGLATRTDAGSVTILTTAPRGRVHLLRWSRLALDDGFRETRHPRTRSPRGP
jgi:polynucleotide 5'-hydroxyl-kinase GRC3/NOL9